MKTKLYKIALKASLVLVFAGEALASPETGHEMVDEVSHAAGHAAEHSSGGLPQLDPTWYASQVFWLFLVFSAAYFIFSKNILPALSSTLESRRELIEGDLEMAKKMKEEAESVRQVYEETLNEARSQASEKLSSSEENLKTLVTEKLSALHDKTTKALQDAEKEVEAAKGEAMKDVNKIAAEVASQTIEKLVGLRADAGKAKSIIDKINKEAA